MSLRREILCRCTENVLRAFFLLLCLCVWLPLRAQSPEEGDSLGLRESFPVLFVTAHKGPSKLNRIGKNIFAIPREQLAHSEGTDLSQLLNQTGFMVNGAYSNPSALKSLFVRGASSKYSLLLYDGVPVLDPSALGGQHDLRMFSSDELSSVELMRGSYSTLYGSAAVAGVLNLRSIRPDSNRPLVVDGYLGLGNLNTYQGNLKLHGSLLGPQKGGLGLSYLIDLGRKQSKGISEALPPSTQRGEEFDLDGFYRNNLSTSLELRYKDVLIKPYLRHTFLSHSYDASGFVDSPAHQHRGDLNVGGIDIDWQYGKASDLRIKLSQQQRFRKYIRPDYVNPQLEAEDTYRGLFRFADLYTNLRLSSRMSLLAGTEYRYEGTPTAHVDTVKRESVAPYLIFQFNPFSSLHMELGSRLNWYTKYGTQLSYDVNPFVLLSEYTKVYASYATSFIAPNLFELTDPSYGNLELTPEQSESIEIGVVSQPKVRSSSSYGLRIGGRVALFHRDIQDVIAWETTGYTNRDQQIDQGLEVEPILYLGNDLRIDIAYGFVSGRVTVDEKQERRLIRLPQHNYRAQIQWTPHNRLLLRTNMQLVGKRLDTDFSSLPPSEERLSSYSLYDLYLAYTPLKKSSLRLFVDLKNIFNEKDYAEIIGYKVPGMRFLLGLRFKF